MSRRNYKYPKKDTSREELVKQVLELYKPSKFQKFFMQAWAPVVDGPFTGNRKRVKYLSSILSLSKEEVIKLEMKYYLGYGEDR